MAATSERRGILYLLILVTIIALAGAFALDGVDAKGRSKVKTSISIRDRVNIQTDNCEMGGGEISVSYAYEDDGSESATTSCSGGLLDGNVCINEATTMECYQAGRVVPPLRGFDGTRPLAPITDVQVDQATPVVMVPVGIEEIAPADGETENGTDIEAGDGPVSADPVVIVGPMRPLPEDERSMPVLVPLK